jgi:uncharacterized membrane protein YphA (DoxX/SURF4 family)
MTSLVETKLPVRSATLGAAGTVAGGLLGAVLLVAAWAKAIDPAAFAEQIHAEGLDRLLPAGVMALLALGLETGLGLALVLGLRRLWVLVPAAFLVAFFVALNGRAWWLDAHGLRGQTAACGCFGNLVERSPREAFWQDLLLLLPPLLLAFAGRRRRPPIFPPARTAVVAAGVAAAVLFAWRAPALPLDDLATRMHPGAFVAKLCAGTGSPVCLDTVIPELGSGEHLVVLGDLDDPALGQAVDSLNTLARAPGAPAVWLLHASGPARQRAFQWKWGPAFKLVEAPAALLRPLYRRLPRSFRIRDGNVVETFPGLPPPARAPAAGARATAGATK